MKILKRQNLYPLIIVMGLSIALIYFYSLFFQGESLIPSPRGPWIDPGPPLWINWSSAEIIHQALRVENIPLWTDKVAIGVPLFADPHLSFFSPFSFILYLAPTSYGWDLMILSKVILLLSFAYMLALRLGLNSWISIFAATLYTYSGHVYQFQHHFHTNSLVFFPLVLIALMDIWGGKLKRGMLLASISFPLIIFGGGLLDLILLTLLLVFISLCYLFVHNDTNASFQIRVSRIGVAAVIFLCSIAIASIWLVPYFELREVAIPPRPGRSAAHYDNIWYLFGLFIKNSMFTDLQYSHWFMKQYQYLSIVALPGFIAGISISAFFKSRYNYIYIGFVTLIVFQILKVYGFPGVQFVSEVPVLRDIRYEKYTGLYTLGFFLIAGYGYQKIFIEKTNYSGLIISLSSFLVVLLLVAYSIKHQLEWSSVLVGYLCMALYPLILYFLWQTKISTVKIGRIAIVFMTIMMILFQLKYDTNTQFSKRVVLFDKEETIDTALTISQTKRFLAIVDAGPRRWSANGLNDVRDISVVHIDRYYNFYKKIIENGGHCWHKFVLCAQADKVSLQGLRWLGVDTLVMTKNNWLLLGKNLDKDWYLAGSDKTYYYVKLENVDPLFMVISTQEFSQQTPTIEQLRKDIALHNPKYYLENEQIDLAVENKMLKWNIDLVKRKGSNLKIKVTSSIDAFLMIKQQYYPGWQASVNGKTVPIYQANYLFQALPIPKGESQVNLVYRPVSLIVGMLISFLAILLLVFLYQIIHARKGFNR